MGYRQATQTMNQQQLYQDLAKLQSEDYQRKCQQYYYDALRGAQQPYNSFGNQRHNALGQPQHVRYTSGNPLSHNFAGYRFLGD